MNQNVSSDTNLRELALTIARNEVGANLPLADVLHGECLSPSEYDQIAANPSFKRYLKQLKAELEENGFSFAAKCRVLAEDLLANAYNMARSDETPAAVRLKALENLVDWGDLKPKTAFAGAGGPGYSIVINLPTSANSAQTTTITLNDTTSAPKPVEVIMELPSAPARAYNPLMLKVDPLPDPETVEYYDAEAAY